MKWGKDYWLKWNTWFAWYPVKIGTQWVWLKTIECYYNGHWHFWSYREVSK